MNEVLRGNVNAEPPQQGFFEGRLIRKDSINRESFVLKQIKAKANTVSAELGAGFILRTNSTQTDQIDSYW